MELWKRIALAEVPWQEVTEGVAVKMLGESPEAGPPILHVRFGPNHLQAAHWHSADTLYLVTAGEMSVGNEGSYGVGDLRWVRNGTYYGPEVAGPEGVEFIVAGLTDGPFNAVYDADTATHLGSVVE